MNRSATTILLHEIHKKEIYLISNLPAVVLSNTCLTGLTPIVIFIIKLALPNWSLLLAVIYPHLPYSIVIT